MILTKKEIQFLNSRHDVVASVYNRNPNWVKSAPVTLNKLNKYLLKEYESDNYEGANEFVSTSILRIASKIT